MNEIVTHMVNYNLAHPEQRKGQAYFNALSTAAPKMAEAVRGTDADPFYDDSRLPDFFLAIAEVLR